MEPTIMGDIVRTSVLLAALAPLAGCGEEPSRAPPGDPRIGRACFDLHLPHLPPGSQYEGFDVAGNVVQVRTMTGAGVERLRCLVGPDGALTIAGPGG